MYSFSYSEPVCCSMFSSLISPQISYLSKLGLTQSSLLSWECIVDVLKLPVRLAKWKCHEVISSSGPQVFLLQHEGLQWIIKCLPIVFTNLKNEYVHSFTYLFLSALDCKSKYPQDGSLSPVLWRFGLLFCFVALSLAGITQTGTRLKWLSSSSSSSLAGRNYNNIKN